MAYSFYTTDATAGQDPLGEETLVAIDECGDTISRLCTELLRGTDTRTGIRYALRELNELLDRLDGLDVSR